MEREGVQNRKKRRLLRRLGWALLSTSLLAALLVFVLLWGVLYDLSSISETRWKEGKTNCGIWKWVYDLPSIDGLERYQPSLTSTVLDRNGEVIGEFYEERRVLTPLSDIPDMVVKAFLAAEDSTFYEHRGIVPIALFRAAGAVVLAGGRKVQGGSTITQQMVKQMLLSPEKSYTRKIREMCLARKIESRYSKQTILHIYLNHIYFGSGAYGIGEAARTYFDKPVGELTVSEAALLAGLPQRPSGYSPIHQAQAADARRRYVLWRMLQERYIDREVYEAARRETPEVIENYAARFAAASDFAEAVRRRLTRELGDAMVLAGGLTVETTLDLELQKAALEEVRTGVEQQDRRRGYRGPLRIALPELLPAELRLLARENGLDAFIEEAADAEGDDGAEQADETAGDAVAAANATSDASAANAATPGAPGAGDADAAEASATTDTATVDAATDASEADAAANDAAADALPVISIPEDFLFEEPKNGVVLEVDDEAGRALIGFGAGVQAEVRLENVLWAHVPEPDLHGKEVEAISEVFVVGDVARFQLGPPAPPEEAEEGETEQEEPAEPEAPAAEQDAAQEDADAPLLYSAVLHQEPAANGALVSFDAKTGDVLAMVGGYDFASSQFNRAVQAQRQTGSAFKPLVYAAALSAGYTPATILYDRPVVQEDETSGFVFKPQNYGRRFLGPLTLTEALARSVNNATVHLLRDLGIDSVIAFARAVGIRAPLERELGVALGVSSMTLLEITRSYGVFVAGGRYLEPRMVVRVSDRFGNVLLEDLPLDPAAPGFRLQPDGTMRLQHPPAEGGAMDWLYAEAEEADAEGEPGALPGDPAGDGDGEDAAGATAGAENTGAASTGDSTAGRALAEAGGATQGAGDAGAGEFSEGADAGRSGANDAAALADGVADADAGEDAEGPPPLPEGHVMYPAHAYLATSLLRAAVDHPGGTGWRARALRRPVGGKTGTTNDNSDAWFVGFSPEYVTGVWVGIDARELLGPGETGSRAAAPIWVNYMRRALEDVPPSEFETPEGIVYARIDTRTGKLAGPNTDKRRILFQAFEAGTEPIERESEAPTVNKGRLQLDF